MTETDLSAMELRHTDCNCCEHAAAIIEALRAIEREKVAAWMIANSIATGHGDTIEDLLGELTRHVEALRASVRGEREGGCDDCGRPYGNEHGFPDLIIPFSAWKRISPSGDDGGLLCPSCICKRLADAGITCEGAFMSGPIETVSRPTMYALRRVENIELAIEGRDNAFAGIRSLHEDRKR